MRKRLVLITALVLTVFLASSIVINVSATIVFPVNSVTINGGAAETGFFDVVLSLTRGLEILGNPVVSMQFTNLDPAVYFDAWMGLAWLPYSNTKEWTLATTGGPGSRTVWARYQLQDGTISTVFSDSIYYDGGGIALPDSVTINGGVATAKTLDVTLTLYRSPRKYAREVVSMSFWVEGEPPVIAE